MNKIKLVTAIATSAIVLGAMAPAAFAATDVVVAENGAFAKTNVKVKNVKATTVAQSNKSHVTNVVKSKTNSGKNTSSFNTGGTSGVGTGPATSLVDVKVGGSSNTANLNSDCGCVGGDTSVAVVGNGAFSHTGVQVSNSSWLTVMQSNVTSVLNAVTSSSNSGGNASSFNTGGSSAIGTGAATSDVNVEVHGSSNTLNQ
ncbi:MAG: hypothetical protein H0W89_04255 [Candidatus Levybacteria bacterium]|nr:hypothetical protein [Candidatus Levybacteria bacterium]